MDKLFFANRILFGTAVFVVENGRRCELVNRGDPAHTGFEWGYGGAGPHDLALSILGEVCGTSYAEKLRGRFVDEVISRLPHEGFELEAAEVERWAKATFTASDVPHLALSAVMPGLVPAEA